MNRLLALCVALSVMAWISSRGVSDAAARGDDAVADPSAAKTPVTLDPVVASPELNRVLLENEHVRVVEYRIEPGQTDRWHTHPAKVSYVVSPGRLRITTEQGQSFEVDEDEGSARWLGPVGIHRGTNIGDTPVRIVYVEIKGVQESGDALQPFLDQQAGN